MISAMRPARVVGSTRRRFVQGAAVAAAAAAVGVVVDRTVISPGRDEDIHSPDERPRVRHRGVQRTANRDHNR